MSHKSKFIVAREEIEVFLLDNIIEGEEETTNVGYISNSNAVQAPTARKMIQHKTCIIQSLHEQTRKAFPNCFTLKKQETKWNSP